MSATRGRARRPSAALAAAALQDHVARGLSISAPVARGPPPPRRRRLPKREGAAPLPPIAPASRGRGGARTVRREAEEDSERVIHAAPPLTLGVFTAFFVPCRGSGHPSQE